MLKLYKLIKHLVFIRSPKLFVRILSGYYKTLILRQNILRSIELSVLYNCQASCHKCYSVNLIDKTKKPLTVEQIKEIINQALKLGLIHVNITGGEPLLRGDIPDIIRACKPDRVMVSLVTNALLLTEDKIKEFKEAGLNTIQISLDSADKFTHDRLRGVSGCYDMVMKGAEWAKKYGINLCFSTVLSTETSSNKREIYRLLNLAEENKAFLLICDSASVGGWENKPDKMFTCEERDNLLEELTKHPYARHHNMYNFRARAGCPAGLEKIYITAYGDVTPCDLIHESFGNVLKEDLKEIWKRLCADERFSQKTYHCVRYLNGGLERLYYGD